MSQDILNLNRTTKSILKNPDPKASLAYTNSILRKDPSKVNVEGIGLNPNVPLEDEYIQNLQKQIHFMDLEIKLMKEKQAQEEALGGNYQFAKIGIADGKPAVDHILTTTNKMKQMKNDLTKQTNLIEQTLMKQKEDNTVSHAKVANLEKHVITYDEKLGKILTENAEALNIIRMKLLTERKQKEDIEIEIMKLRKVLEKVLDDNERLRKDTELRDINQNLAKKQFDDDEKLDAESLEVKMKLITELQMEDVLLITALERDPRLHALREENENLLKKAKEAEKRLDNCNYKVLETETLQALSAQKKEQDIEIKKKLQAELDKWKDQYDETLKANELKVERKLREAESPLIKELQAELLKEKHELADLKIKLDNITKKEKEYIIDKANRKRYKNGLEKKKETNMNIDKLLVGEIRELDPVVNDLQDRVEKLKLKCVEGREEREKLQGKLKTVEEEHIVLLSKFQFMQKNMKLEDDMKKFNINELQNVIKTNQDVNETIHSFMNKWDELKKFSKMP